MPVTAANGPPEAAPRALPPLPKDWRALPEGCEGRKLKDLRRRLLSVQTSFGVIAGVHLEKVCLRRGINVENTGVCGWIFDSHHIVMGDMNAVWPSMTGRPHMEGRDGTVRPTEKGWVNSTTHTMATRAGGTYLPGMTQKMPEGVEPPPFDLVVVHRPLSVKALPEKHDRARDRSAATQPGKPFVRCKLPRSLMTTLQPNGWPSDHTSVVATVRTPGCGATGLVVATWNVADPWYFEKFWPDCSFGFDKKREPARLEAVRQHVKELLGLAGAVALQEVPAALVPPLLLLGVKLEFQVQYAAAPSDSDTEWYEKVAGRRRCSSDGDRAADVPPVAHDMLFAKQHLVIE